MALEDTLRSWAKAPGQTELDKCDNAVTAVRKAIDANEKLSKLSIKVFAQGSYCKRRRWMSAATREGSSQIVPNPSM